MAKRMLIGRSKDTKGEASVQGMLPGSIFPMELLKKGRNNVWRVETGFPLAEWSIFA